VKLAIHNGTRFRTADIRRMLLAAVRHQGIGHLGDARVRVVRARKHCSGRATLGSRREPIAKSMLLRLPPRASPERVANLIHHEVLHWAGVRHRDMTPDVRWATDRPPAWFDPARHVLEPELASAAGGPRPDPGARLRAAAMRAKAVTRLKRARTIEQKWAKKIKLATNRVAKLTQKHRDGGASRANQETPLMRSESKRGEKDNDQEA
jgi:hypothetical protein